jgi:SAM-dependent methyltransferase
MLSLERQNKLREYYRLQNPGWRPATEVYADCVRHRLESDSRILDLGCGRGGLVEQLGHSLSLAIGVDPDLQSLREHRLPLPRAQAFSSRLPFAGGQFDLVFASWLLEHLPRPDGDLKEISRVLRTGGRFVFITPNKRHPLAYLNRFLGHLGALQRWLVSRLYGRQGADTFPTYYRANEQKTLAYLSKRCGLNLEELHVIPDPTYLAFTPALLGAAQRLDAWLSPDKQLHLVGVLKKE